MNTKRNIVRRSLGVVLATLLSVSIAAAPAHAAKPTSSDGVSTSDTGWDRK